MFSNRIISKVRKEMSIIGFDSNGEFSLIKVKKDVWVLRFTNAYSNYVVKFYENGCAREIFKYEEMEKFGIKMVKCLARNDKVMIFADYDDGLKYRNLRVNCLSDKNDVELIAKWYRELHKIEPLDIDNCYEEFNIKNVEMVMNKFNLKRNMAMCYIHDNFNNINLKFKRLRKCYVMGGDFLENLRVQIPTGDVVMCDFDELSIGYRYEDIKLILEMLNDDNKFLFMKEYGNISEDEKIIDFVVSCVIKLYKMCVAGEFPGADNRVIKYLNDNQLLKNAQSLVEWY